MMPVSVEEFPLRLFRLPMYAHYMGVQRYRKSAPSKTCHRGHRVVLSEDSEQVDNKFRTKFPSMLKQYSSNNGRPNLKILEQSCSYSALALMPSGRETRLK